jgi:hypothetical protein
VRAAHVRFDLRKALFDRVRERDVILVKSGGRSERNDVGLDPFNLRENIVASRAGKNALVTGFFQTARNIESTNGLGALDFFDDEKNAHGPMVRLNSRKVLSLLKISVRVEGR